MGPANHHPALAGVGIISTYPPRKCGIATFTRDLAAALRALPAPSTVQVAAINGAGETYAYPPEVVVQIDETAPDSYMTAAEKLNRSSNVDVVSVQHDFGKFGVWRNGFEVDYLAPMLAALQKPVVVTLHSVPRAPNTLMRQTIQAAGKRAVALVVMAEAARALLHDDYQLDGAAMARVRHIPHGVPVTAAQRLPTAVAKRLAGVSGQRVLSTFGLLSEGKGIELVIRAMPALVGRYPDVRYLVIGQTHPEVRKREGERYRESLFALARALGVREHVQFLDRYLSEEAIFGYLAATDVYVTPYLAHDQITSGTLAYALAAGKAIVSTPYRYAEELLADGRGVLTPFQDPASLGKAVRLLLDDAALRGRLENNAARYGEGMAWPRVAARYRRLFDQAPGPALAIVPDAVGVRRPSPPRVAESSVQAASAR